MKTTSKDTEVEEQLSYRGKMQVNEMFLSYDGSSYAVCPRCACLIDIEYVPYCSQCGQKLGWRGYFRSKIINQ